MKHYVDDHGLYPFSRTLRINIYVPTTVIYTL